MTSKSRRPHERVLPSTRSIKETAKGAKQARSRAASVVRGSNPGTIAVVPQMAAHSGSNGALAMSEQWLGALLAHSSDLIAVVDDRARVIYTNEAAERILGFVPDEQTAGIACSS